MLKQRSGCEMNEAQCDEVMRQLRLDIDDHETRLRTVEQSSTERKVQYENLLESLGGIKALIAQIDTKVGISMQNLEKDIKQALEGLDSRLKKLEEADGAKWKQAVWIVFALVAGGAIGKIMGG